MKTEIPEFPFCSDLPVPEDVTPRGLLLCRIGELRDDGLTMAQIARQISPGLSWRTVEAWSQYRTAPKPWVCELILEKLSCNGPSV